MSMILTLTLPGCTGAAPRPTPAHEQVAPAPPLERSVVRVALVPARFEPEVELPSISSYTLSTLKGAGGGLVGGALGGGLLGGQVGCGAVVAVPESAIFCGLFVVAGAVGGAVIGLPLGTVHGIAEGAPREETANAKKSLRPAIAALKLQQPLADAVQSSAKDAIGQQLPEFSSIGPTAQGIQIDYKTLASQGFESVLEISVTRFGFDSAGGKDPEVALFMVVHARRVDALTGKELWSGEFAYLSRYAPLPAWADGEVALVRSERGQAYRALGERVVDEVFLHMVRPQVEHVASTRPDDHPACGLRPVDPPLEIGSRAPNPDEAVVVDNAVDSLQPTLRWEAFNFPGGPSNILVDAVRYDLRVWRATSNTTVGDLIYSQTNIPGPSHTLLQPLEPGAKYFWSVRARYASGGAIYGTRWSESRSPPFVVRTGFLASVYADRSDMLKRLGVSAASLLDVHSKLLSPCALDFIPGANYHRFRTKPVDTPKSAETVQTRGSGPFSPVGSGVPATGGTDGMFARKR